jgi:hypothetical protein
MKLLNATNLNRKSGIRGPKTTAFFECFLYRKQSLLRVHPEFASTPTGT